MEATFPVRSLQLLPDADTPRYWFAGDPFVTHFFNAISSTFPEGERFFIKSVRRFMDRIDDPQLEAEVRQFVKQEAQHYQIHDKHVDLLVEQGYVGLRAMNRFAERGMSLSLRATPRFALATTTAVEHFTATLAAEMLDRADDWLAPMDSAMRDLWRWHALEELEHRCVALDVYEATIDSAGLRRAAMLFFLPGFLTELAFRHTLLMVRDRQFSPRVWWRGLRRLWGRGGLLRALVPEIGRYFRADFRPAPAERLDHYRQQLGPAVVSRG
ncbi:MAG: metal-dependent hydrolase [Pseudomonadota bacterium]